MDKKLFQHTSAPLRGKGIGVSATALGIADASAQGWSILHEDVSLPAAVLRHEALLHNLEWMRRFTAAYGVHLAPHGKTTMSPELFRLQLQSGAWGITVATAPQAREAWLAGARRILMANQLVGKANMAIVAELLRDAGTELFCLVDSPDNVAALGGYFRPQALRVGVLLEIGAAGGRTGVRDAAQVHAVIAELARWPDAVQLAGVEVYEGVAPDEAGVRAILQHTVTTFQQLHQAGALARRPALVSGAGSAWFDVVAEEFSVLAGDPGIEVVLRPGCYLTHDVGIYRDAAKRIHASNPVARQMGSSLQPALQLWAYVQSRPEPGKAIIALGKRDAAFDAGFPVPALHYRPGTAAPVAAAGHWKITAMMDQHAFLDVGDQDDLRVGDMLCFDISHPCLTFDKWRHLLVVDDAYTVVDAISTQF
ncbi:amino acid deaminase [Stenotrophomonas pictorum JCM 9942]|uniref:Amino acid deaminase n=2 Tax=Stenotrophomonas pictorum TaxID=86184 RepID=A0A0R0AUB7_9GAMM|nr:amino acid deaminase [Stenotrophomonas pictorum JCM 9942]